MALRSPRLLLLALLLTTMTMWSGGVHAAQHPSVGPAAKLKCKYGTKTITKKVHGKKKKVKVCKSKPKPKPTATPRPTDTPLPTNTPTNTPTAVPTSTNISTPTATATTTKAAPKAIAVSPVQQTVQPATTKLAVGVHASYPVGSNPSAIATGDFNHDGKPDLAVVNRGSNTVSILINDGTGKFLPKVDYPTGKNPSSVAVGDLNGDGLLDIAVANAGSDSVSIYINHGDGTFAAPPAASTHSAWARSTNHMPPAGRPHQVRVFTPVNLNLPPGSGPVDVEWLSVDNTPRLVTLNPGTKSFAEFSPGASAPVITTFDTLGMGDVYAMRSGRFIDGQQGSGPNQVILISKSTDGGLTFGPATVFPHGTLDLVNNQFYSFSGYQGFQPDHSLATGIGPSGVDIGAFEVQSAPGSSNGGVVVWDGSSGSFIFSFLPFDQPFSGGSQVAIGDVNGDGFPDIIVDGSSGGGPAVRVFEKGTDANGLFTQQTFNLPAIKGNPLPGIVVAADGSVNIEWGDGTTGQGNVFVTRFVPSASLFACKGASWLTSNDFSTIIQVDPSLSGTITGLDISGPPVAHLTAGPFLAGLQNYSIQVAGGVVKIIPSAPNVFFPAGPTTFRFGDFPQPPPNSNFTVTTEGVPGDQLSTTCQIM